VKIGAISWCRRERLVKLDIGQGGVIGDRAYGLREASGRV
jgi:hypothetical protein